MRTDVRFPTNGLQLAGHLYLPDGADGPLAAIVVGHPTTGVKEQAPAVYATRLVEAGFAVLTFDAAFQGESEGMPRGLEDPFQRAEDFRAAVSYLTTRPEIDSERIGVMGVCGSGAYAPYAAQTDHRMKAVAGVSGTDVPSFFRGADPEGWHQMVAASGNLRSAEAAGEPAATFPVLPERITADTPAPTAEFVDYYKTPRGHHPRSTGDLVVRSADLLDQFDSFADVAKIAPRPLLMIAGTEAVTRGFSEKAVADSPGNAELFLVEGATHVDLYDRDQYVAPAVAKLVEFFGKHLA
ncbi:alpha/beta hydrolase [Streptomyces sp. NEAU-sy36]|uniref:alpha/beta hydrolase n=1 Tax=unclassified Streptomyces TaxID=2593676 RepID=UPI0015D5A1EA|nr:MULTISPECIES: alpha/beta hydrolase [unclassified Streptomyces]QLJ01666.1 alpha/beta hydrolase [Streptomyces sp. NEAU-sy36]